MEDDAVHECFTCKHFTYDYTGLDTCDYYRCGCPDSELYDEDVEGDDTCDGWTPKHPL